MERPEERNAHEQSASPSQTIGAGVSRRQFLKMAGVAGAAIGVGGGLGGLVAACGGDEATTTTAAPTETTSAPVTTGTTAAASTTTVSAGAEQGRLVKVGMCVPKTGVYNEFAKPIAFLAEQTKAAVGGSIVMGDGKQHPIEFVEADTQSDANRAAQVAADLITNDKVDIILSEGSPDNVLGPAEQAEALGCPSLSANCPWNGFVFGRGGSMDKAFEWTFIHAFGVQDNIKAAIDSVDRFKEPTNKKVALLYPNNANGLSYVDEKTGVPPVLTEKGYTFVLPDLYPPGMEDFTQLISLYKKEGCEILMGSASTPDMSNFWKQSLQQGFQPKLLANGIALLFPKGIESIGETMTNALAEVHWHPTYPFVSSLTGQTAPELVEEYEAKTGTQWSMPLLLHKLFEWAVDVLKRSADPDDPKTVADAIRSTNLQTIHGTIDFTQPINEIHLHPNVVRSPVIAGQWQKGTGKWPFELVVVGNEGWPELPVGGEVLPLMYS